MYKERKANIAAFRGCGFNCVYCAFSKMLKLSSCPMCKSFKPHSHMEVLGRIPPKTSEGEFLTIGLSSDISFMDVNNFCDVLDYCSKYGDRTFLIQSKNPGYFLQFAHRITSNVIIGTTIESNRLITDRSWETTTCFYDRGDNGYEPISQAPSFSLRDEAMKLYNGRKAVTIEPILDFDIDAMEKCIKEIKPEIVWIGYDSHPEKNNLIEPSLYKVDQFVKRLKDAEINVKLKLIRNPVRTMDAHNTSARPK